MLWCYYPPVRPEPAKDRNGPNHFFNGVRDPSHAQGERIKKFFTIAENTCFQVRLPRQAVLEYSYKKRKEPI